MAWEWNWPRLITPWKDGGWKSFVMLDVYMMQRDHSPGFYVFFGMLGFAILDFGYYNAYHKDEQ
jgi:hypothetical protein